MRSFISVRSFSVVQGDLDWIGLKIWSCSRQAVWAFTPVWIGPLASGFFMSHLHCSTGFFRYRVYHEFGHSVFEKFPRFLAAMQQQVREHFDELRRGIGPDAIRATRSANATLASCRNVLEMSDGWVKSLRPVRSICQRQCQFHFRMIDLAGRDGLPPYDLLDPDYPPNAANLRRDAVGRAKPMNRWSPACWTEWSEFTTQHNDSPSYRDTCSEALRRIAWGCFRFTAGGDAQSSTPCEPLP